jgi:hypothetical protein
MKLMPLYPSPQKRSVFPRHPTPGPISLVDFDYPDSSVSDHFGVINYREVDVLSIPLIITTSILSGGGGAEGNCCEKACSQD